MRLELRGITKRFGNFTANDSIDLVVEAGEIHSLLGENGAGKSTLMNVLYGLYTADEGEILLDGVPQSFDGPGDAMAAGIGMVHQHFMLVPVFTVAENVILGNESTSFAGQLDMTGAREKVREIASRFGFHVDPDAVIEDLPVGVQQRVEIIKALSRDANVLIFDEPTAVLTPQETDELMEIMRQLKAEGKAIVFITHKLREVREVADKITVIRRGKVVGEASPTSTDAELAELMVGRAVELVVPKGEPQYSDSLFEVSGLEVTDESGMVVVDDVSFSIRGGEVLVVAGVQGNGQTELAEAIVGLRRASGGSVRLDGEELIGKTVRRVLDEGVGFVPEDRSVEGLVGALTVAENLILDRTNDPEFVRMGSLRLGVLEEFATAAVDEFDIRTGSINAAVGTLSGGNQQKVVIARELSRELKFLLASQPTRGVDVGSIEFIHRRIIEARDSGVPVLVVSTELDEAANLGDRILVMYHGRIAGIVPADTPRHELGLLMAGVTGSEEVA
ncbi:MAG TPA: ABC transporter ATP-binding protein [Actinomycetales bacterium]|nr:ABC transporter ATP-binding protein [Actinomycetales bacterium]